MPILMAVSKSTQVLSKFYFSDTPEQDQKAWEQKGLSGLISAIRPGLQWTHFVCFNKPWNKCLHFHVSHMPVVWNAIAMAALTKVERTSGGGGGGARFKNIYELLNLRALKCSPFNKIHTFQSMDKIFCVEFQRYPFKSRTKYLAHTWKDMVFIQHWNLRF